MHLLVNLLSISSVTDPSCFVHNKDYSGDLLDVVDSVENAVECELLCRRKNGCHWFTYFPVDFPDRSMRKKCHFKRFISAKQIDAEGVIAGPTGCVWKGDFIIEIMSFD